MEGKLANKFIYTGVFFDKSEIEKIRSQLQGVDAKPLTKEIAMPHVTFQFQPKDFPTELFGEYAAFDVVGYASDGKNEGVEVRLNIEKSNIPQELVEMYNKIPKPHITLSVSEDGKPVDTAKLDFIPLKTPISIGGNFGAFDVKQKNPVIDQFVVSIPENEVL